MTIAVLLLSASDRRVSQWRDALAATQCRVLTEPATPQKVDVIVTDRDIPSEAFGDQVSGEIGVVSIGAHGPADVALPGDASDRELSLAALLLGQIVRLRRQRNEDQRARRVLSHLAMSDSLTGLPNRRAWDDETSRRLGQVQRLGTSLCLTLLDFDHFKRVNDDHGHQVGDSVLRELSAALVTRLRGEDFVARLGGDEFGVLISEVDAETAGEIVERVRDAVGDDSSNDAIGKQTLSAGVAMARPGESVEWLFARADEALRTAKSQGRDKIIRAD